MDQSTDLNTDKLSQPVANIPDTQGKGKYTSDKEIAFANTISEVFKSGRTAINNINQKWWSNYPFHFIDLFAGSGFNIPPNGGEPIEGTPLTSARHLNMFSIAGVKINPFFIESNEASATLLKSNLTKAGFGHLAGCVCNCDAQEEFLPAFEAHVAKTERVNMAMGLMIVDPNVLYRSEKSKKNKRPSGIHVAVLRDFMRRFRRIDVLMRIDLRFHQLATGHILYNGNKMFLEQIMPIETLLGTYLEKEYWFVNPYHPSGKALIVFGSNYLKGVKGMLRVDKDQGREIIRNAEGDRNKGWRYNPLIPGSLPILPFDPDWVDEDEEEEEEDYDPDWAAFDGHIPEEE